MSRVLSTCGRFARVAKIPLVSQTRFLSLSIQSLLKSDEHFAAMSGRVNADTVKKVKGVFQFDIMEGKKVVKTWTADLKNGDGALFEGKPEARADVIMQVTDENFVKIASGQMDPQEWIRKYFGLVLQIFFA